MNINNKTTLRYKNNKPGIVLALVVFVFSAVSMSCNLPALTFLPGFDRGGIESSLTGSGLLNVNDISVGEDQVIITYEVLPEDDPEVMLIGWINALKAAADASPDAGEYILTTTSSGKPYLEIWADGMDVRGYAADEISLDMLLERLDITDIRPLADRVREVLGELELDIIQVSQIQDTLIVEYYPEAASDSNQLMDEWWSIFAILAEHEHVTEKIQIRAVMPDTSVFVVEGDGEGLYAFISGEITAIDYLAGLVITEEPVVLEGE